MLESTNHFQTSYATLHRIMLLVKRKWIHTLEGFYSINYRLAYYRENLSFTNESIRFARQFSPCILILQD